MVSYSDYVKGKGEVYLVLILIVMDNGLLPPAGELVLLSVEVS